MIEVTERHLSEAYASEHNRLMALAGDGEPSALWHKLVREFQIAGYDSPAVKGEAKLIALREAFWGRCYKLYNEIPAAPEPASGGDTAKRFMDEGHEGNGWKPSALFEIGRNLGGKDFETWALNRARQRYRDGNQANPFTNTMRKRG